MIGPAVGRDELDAARICAQAGPWNRPCGCQNAAGIT